MTRNIHSLDQFARLLLGTLAGVASGFWLGGAPKWIAAGVAFIMVATAWLRFCPLYAIFGMSSAKSSSSDLGATAKGVAWLLVAAVAAGGSYASLFLTKKFFLEDFNVMNDSYKQTLFLTGKAEREKANANYDELLKRYPVFKAKYQAYQPWALRGDAQFTADLDRVDGMIQGVNTLVRTGDLHEAHLALEQVRPVFQDIFKRNGFSMLAVALVDFHDAMESMLDAATAKDDAKLQALYPAVSTKLQAVEAEAQDAEIQAIRAALDKLHQTAQARELEALPALGDQLKSAFVNVYLQRG